MAAEARRHAGWIAGRILGPVACIRVGLPTSNLDESEIVVSVWDRDTA